MSSAYSLNTFYTADSAQFYSAFFANNDKFNSALSPKTQNLDYTFSPKLLKMIKNCTVMKLYSAYSATTLSYARPFQRKQGVIETIDNLGKFDKDFRNCG